MSDKLNGAGSAPADIEGAMIVKIVEAVRNEETKVITHVILTDDEWKQLSSEVPSGLISPSHITWQTIPRLGPVLVVPESRVDLVGSLRFGDIA